MRLEKYKSLFFNNCGFIIIYISLSLTYLLSLQYLPATLIVEMKVSESDTGQLFYDNSGMGYRETDSIVFTVGDSNEFQNYHLKIPRGKISSVRIDPMTQKGNFIVRSVTINTANRQLRLDEERLRETLIPLNQVELFYSDSVVYGTSTGDDPQLALDGAHVVNRYPVYISALALLSLLLLLWGAKKIYFNYQYELSFTLFLLIFALPIVLPLYFSLICTVAAVALFLDIIFTNRSQSELPLVRKSNYPDWAWLNNRNLVYSCCLVLLLLLAFLLRFWNLTILDPYTDEYSHLLAAKDYLDTGVLNYTRARLVTYLAALFFRIGNPNSFYEYLFWGRVPGVIFSTLTAVPLYFLTRKISPPVALISTFLWATSPWAIGVAKTIREYAFYPFFILLGALALVKLLELLFDYKREYLLKIILCLIPIIAFIGYAFRYDIASTLRICGIIFAGIAAYYLVLHFNQIKTLFKTNKVAFSLVILLVGSIAISMLVYANRSGHHVNIAHLKLSDYWFRIFFVPGGLSTPMHWWGDYSFIFIAVFIAATGFFYAALNRRRKYFLHLAVFSALLIFFTFFFDRYGRPRYIFYALPFFIPLAAVSIEALVGYVNRIKPFSLRVIASLAVAIFLFQAFNYQNILYPVFSNEHGYVKTTNEHHDSLKSTMELLEREIGPDDVFITTIARSMLLLAFNIDKERISSYNYSRAERFEKVEKIIEENPQGFMILDWRRNGHFSEGYPKEGQFMIGNTIVEVIQNKDGMQVYRWKR